MDHFFILQRGLGGRGLERSSEGSGYNNLFYKLFLDLYNTEIPEKYTRSEYDDAWQTRYVPHLDACVEFIRRVHATRPYDFNAPPRM